MAGALLGIATVVVLITWLRSSPIPRADPWLGDARHHVGHADVEVVDAFTAGVGSTLGGVGLLIALGAMTGALLADSGSANRLVETVAGRFRSVGCRGRSRPSPRSSGFRSFSKSASFWSCRFSYSSAGRIDVPLMKIGIPALAGLSVLHGLVPRIRGRSSPCRP